MTWNYRLVKSTYKGEGYEEVNYEIREAYYNKDGGVWAITENGARAFGETPEEIKIVLDRMRMALDRDIIDEDTFVPDSADFEDDNAGIVQ